MAAQSDPSDSRSSWFLAGPPLAWIAILLAFLAINGRLDRPFPEILIIIVVTLPLFLIVGLFAYRGSRQGTSVGVWAAVCGMAPLLALFYEGYREYQQALQDHAWTGASLTGPVIYFAAFPIAFVGAFIGRLIGIALVGRKQ
ncbi:MAG TPA: hypothetical protein VGP68_00735 [Gemmataceae bacterium]|jgi:hypothetical protein|nr:hypothetical protein [Gemmataceae bacterium]